MALQNVQGVKPEPHSVLVTGKKTVSGNNAATQLTVSDTPCKGVWVSADPSAGQHFAIGDSNVGSGTGAWQGTIIYPGAPGIFCPVDNVSKVYFSGATGAIACFTYFT